jgi:hypothetical protein
MKKKATKRAKKNYVTFDDLKQAARGTPEDAQELLDALKEHRAQQRELLRTAKRARSATK